MNIIITGASKGLGRSMALQFAEDKNNTLLVCARGEVGLYNLVQEIQTYFPDVNIKAMPIDMAKKEEVIAFAEWCLSFGKPDILINNAGTFLPGTIADEDEGILETMMTTNLYSAYYLTRALLPSMIEHKSGHIFNICSIASLTAYNNGGSYSISKFALHGFSKNLREELKPKGIKVTGVFPGAAYTDSWSGSGIDPNRIMEADDVAKMVYAATKLSAQGVVEDIILRPQLGDL